jgi:hypothetical protein
LPRRRNEEYGTALRSLHGGRRISGHLIDGLQAEFARVPFATHRFELDEMTEAYDTFADAAATDASKVVLSGHPVHLPEEERALAAAR